MITVRQIAESRNASLDVKATQPRILFHLYDCSSRKTSLNAVEYRRSAVPGKATKTRTAREEEEKEEEEEEENERTGDSCIRVVTNLIPDATRSELTQRRLSSRRRVVPTARG